MTDEMTSIEALKVCLAEQDKRINQLVAMNKALQLAVSKLYAQAPAPQQNVPQPPTAVGELSSTCKVISFERRAIKNGQIQVRIMTDTEGLMFMFGTRYDALMQRDLNTGDMVDVQFNIKNGFKGITGIKLHGGIEEEIPGFDEEGGADETMPF